MLHPLGKWGYLSCLPVGFLATWHFLCREKAKLEKSLVETQLAVWKILLKLSWDFLLGDLVPRWNSYTLSFCMNLESVHVYAAGFINGFGRSGFPFSRMFHIKGLHYSDSLYLIFFPPGKKLQSGGVAEEKQCALLLFSPPSYPLLILKQGSGIENLLILHVKIAHLKIRIIF